METYLYLCRSYTGAVNMLKQARGYAPELLGQLFVPRPESTECTIYVEVALGSPDIGDQLQEAMTMIPYIRLSCPRPDVVDMYAYISGSPSRLLGQLYVNLSPIDPRVWYFPAYQRSPDIEDEPQPAKARTMNPFIYLSCQSPGVIDIDLHIGLDPGRLLGQLYVPYSAHDPHFWHVSSYLDSPDIGEEPKPQEVLIMEPFIYLSCPSIGVIDMDLHIGLDPGRLLGQLYMYPSMGGDLYIWPVPSYQDSPDIGDEPDDQQPPEVSEDKAAARKGMPIARGVLDYFPAALLKLAEVSRVGNDQHNPGQPMHWAYDRSSDHADALLRHLIDRRELDVDGVPHTAKVAWRALALLQTYLEGQDPKLHARMEEQRAAMKEGR